MGLGDVPNVSTDDSSSTSSSSSSSGSGSSDPGSSAYKVIGSDEGTRRIYEDEESWQKVVEVVEEEMDYSMEEVMNQPENKRSDIIFQATYKANTGEWYNENRPHVKVRCFICGHECLHDGVEIEDRFVCKGHSAGTVRERLDEIEEGNYENVAIQE